MARRPPWYAFLYILLGAHGTFWLWIVTVATLWWTWHGAVLSMVNRSPERRSVSDAAQARDLRRWVVLPGVRLALDGQLFLVEDASDFEGVEILIDEDDPTARFWRTTRLIADVDAGVHDERLRSAAGAISETAGAGLRAGKLDARRTLETRLLMLESHRVDPLPKSEAAILLLPDSIAAPNTASNGKVITQGGSPEEYEQRLRAWRDSVRAHVHVVSPQGLLDTAPSTVIERIRQNPGVPLGQNALRANRSPNDTELYVFCGAALIFLFLATGLWGVASTKAPTSP